MGNSQSESSKIPKDVDPNTTVPSGALEAAECSRTLQKPSGEQSESRAVVSDLIEPADVGTDEKTMDNEPRKDSNADVSSGQGEKILPLSVYKERTISDNYHLMGYPTPILKGDLFNRATYHEVVDEKQFPYMAFLSFGLHNFMSYAAHFCKYEAQNNADIISVGSGNGMVDKEIIATYRKHFGEDIKITLVDPNPDYEVDFRVVDDLIRARPEIVGNCIVLILWPDPMGENDGYDIDAIRELRPLAALVLYDPTEVSGSDELTGFLRYQTKETVGCGFNDYSDVGFGNYAVEKVTSLEVYTEAGRKFEMFGREMTTGLATRLYSLRLLKLKKIACDTF